MQDAVKKEISKNNPHNMARCIANLLQRFNIKYLLEHFRDNYFVSGTILLVAPKSEYLRIMFLENDNWIVALKGMTICLNIFENCDKSRKTQSQALDMIRSIRQAHGDKMQRHRVEFGGVDTGPYRLDPYACPPTCCGFQDIKFVIMDDVHHYVQQLLFDTVCLFPDAFVSTSGMHVDQKVLGSILQ